MEFGLVQFVMEIKDTMEGIWFELEMQKDKLRISPKLVMLMWELEILIF